MNEPLQSGNHPDADQIGAFVEHALPAHEQERVLDHLAVCPECRAVVALSLPEVEEPAKPLPAPARKTWWSGWSLAWTATAAVVALAFLVVYIQRVAHAPGGPAQPQIAAVHPPEALVSRGHAPAADANVPLHGSQNQPAASSHGNIAGKGSAEGQRNTNLAISGRNLDALQMEAPSSAAVEKQVPLAAAMSKGVVSGLTVRQTSGAEFRAQSPVPPVVAGTAKPSVPPAPAAAGIAPAIGSNQTVSVASAVPMETVSSNAVNVDVTVDEAQLAQLVQLKHLLPSRLPVMSMAAQGRLIVAIDTQNAVFLSKDAGKHWKAVQTQWPGRAVRAGLVESGSGLRSGSMFDKAAAKGAVLAGAAESSGDENRSLSQQDRLVASSRLTGTVTDRTGAAIQGASVAIVNAGRTIRTVRTDGAGHYIVDGLAPGTYRVEAQAAGFMKQDLAAVAVTASGPAVADLALTVGAAAETVTVEADSMAVSDDMKTKAKLKAASQAAPVFEITTDTDGHWTSTDGVTWKRM